MHDSRVFGIASAAMSVAVVGTVGSFGFPNEAHACSGPQCRTGEVFPLQGQMPSNVAHWVLRPTQWSGDYDAGASSDVVRLDVAASDAGVDYELSPQAGDETRLSPTSPLEPGDVVTVEYESHCDNRTLHTGNVTITAPAPLPTSLGTLDVTPQHGYVQLQNYSGSCSEQVYASILELHVVLGADVQPFEDVLRYRLWVDGERYRAPEMFWGEEDQPLLPTLSGSPLGLGRDRIFTICDKRSLEEDYSALAEGSYIVQMRGELPDGTVVASDELELELRCEHCAFDDGEGSCLDGGPAAGPDDAGPTTLPTPASPDGSAPTPGNPTPGNPTPGTPDPEPSNGVDGSGANDDAAATPPTRPNGDLDAGLPPPVKVPVTEDTDDGCACSTVGTGAASARAAWTLALLLGLLLRRRRSEV